MPEQADGHREDDWKIFEILCGDGIEANPCPDTTLHSMAEHHHPLDLVTALRSELAAISCKRDHLISELSDAKSALCAKETECDSLRAQAARQSALISSLQSRLQAAESREHSVQSRCDSTIQTIQREKRSVDERNKEQLARIQHLEANLANEEIKRQKLNGQLQDLIRRLCSCFGMDVRDALIHLSPDTVVERAEEIMTELHRTRAKVTSTCDTLASCENELHNVKSLANVEKQRLSAQLDAAHNHNHELENRCRQYEQDLQIARDRLIENDIDSEKLKDELRGFESRCHRLQNGLDRSQSDRLQFLRALATQLQVPEPCETLIKDKLHEVMNDNLAMNSQLHSLREQLSCECMRLKQVEESSQCRIETLEADKKTLEDRIDKFLTEIETLRRDHSNFSEHLLRIARALDFGECCSPPSPGAETTILVENLVECAEQLISQVDHHGHVHGHGHGHGHGHVHMLPRLCSPVKGGCGHQSRHHSLTKLKRDRSCHDISSTKETTNIYNLQRRVRFLREQVQRRDLHLELLRRKLAIIEDGAKGKCALKSERDEAVFRLKKANKQIDKLTSQLCESNNQLTELQDQLTGAVEYKITALERTRKIDELTSHICDLEEEKTRLKAQVSALKERLKSSSESAQNRRGRDEALINSLRDDIARMQSQLSDANHRLSHLQSFRTSVARTLHLHDLPEADLLHRLQALCSAHQEFTLLSRRYESASPVGDHPCPRYDDEFSPPTTHCHPPAQLHPPYGSSSRHHRHRSKSSTGGGGKLYGDIGDSNPRKHCCSGGGSANEERNDDDFGLKGKYC